MSKRKQRQDGDIFSGSEPKEPMDLAHVAAEIYGDQHRLNIRESKRIQVHSDGTNTYGRFRLNPTSIEAPSDVTFDEWSDLGATLSQIQGAMQFWIGDWANLHRGAWGDMYSHIADVTGLDERTIRNLAWVCRRVPKEWRHEQLSFSHHYALASLPKELQESVGDLLKLAIDKNMSARQFAAYINHLKALETDPDPTDPWVWLFQKPDMPELNAQLRKTWEEARAGDKFARDEVLEVLKAYEKWIHAVRRTLGV